MRHFGWLKTVVLILLSGCSSDFLNPDDSEKDLLFLNQATMYEGRDILVTDLNEYVIVGKSVSESNLALGMTARGDFTVAKISQTGKLLWIQKFGNILDDCAIKIKPVSDGSYIVAGTIADTNSMGVQHTDIGLVNLMPDGTVNWYKVYGGEGNQVVNDIEETNDGGFLVAGSTDTDPSGFKNLQASATDMMLFKTNGLGDSLWTEAFGYQGNDYATDVEELQDGSLLAIGSTEQSFGQQTGYNILLVKTNQFGKGPVNRILGGVQNDFGIGVEVAQDGFMLAANIVEFTHSKVSVIKLGFDIYSDPLFVKEIPLEGSGHVESFLIHEDRLVFSGHQNGNENYHILFLLLNQQGDLITKRIYGGSNAQKAVAVTPLPGAGYILLISNQFAGGNITGLIRLNSSGGLY